MTKIQDVFSALFKTIEFKRAFFLPFLLIFSCSVSSQSIEQAIEEAVDFDKDPLRFKHFTLDDGLSQVSINDLLLDKLGFVWIATQDGLNKFDGTTFKHFKHSESDSLTISGNLINKLLLDKNGNVWIASIGNGNGLSYYDQNSGIIHTVKLKFSQEENEVILDLESDKNNSIWIASGNSGLHKLESLDNGSFLQKNYFPEQPINALLIDEEHTLWVGSFNGTIFKLNIDDENAFEQEPLLSVEGQILAFYKTRECLLIGTSYGLYTYNLETKKVALIELQENGSVTKQVSCFLKAGGNKVWIGTGNGLFLFDWHQKKVVRKISYSNSNGLSSSNINALLRLPDNQVLVGTSKYLNLLDFEEPYFQNISKDQRGDHLLNDNVIFSIFKDAGDLWIGTSDGGLNLIRNNTSYYFTENQKNPNSISGNVVRAIVKDKENMRLWLATTRGLSMIDLKTFDPDNPTFKVFHNDPKDLNSISGDFIKDIALDNDNNLWGSAYGYGIFRLELLSENKAHIYRYKNERNNLNSLKNDFVQRIQVDAQNNVWISTQEGITKLSIANNDFKHPNFTNYYRDGNLKNTLSQNTVYDFVFDKENSLWLGTRNGLNLFSGNNEFKAWTAQDQFPNALIYSIQDDEYNNLWLGTNDGIVKFDSRNKAFSHYGVEDGIQSREFNIHAKFKDDKGNIYLGGIGGVTYFSPLDLEKIDIPKPLYFTQLRVKNKEINPSDPSQEILSKVISKTAQLTFKHNQFPFYLDFSSIDFRLNKNVSYAYRLLPSNTEWNTLKDKEIQFLDLLPGNYTLQVNGFSRGKEWTQPPLEMILTISPPWHKTWEAYMAYILLVITSISFIIRWRSKELIKQNVILEETIAQRTLEIQNKNKILNLQTEKLVEVNQSKTRLYSNISHEFRTPLTVILGMADALKSDFDNKVSKNTDTSLEMIRRNGKNLLHLVNELLDLAKLESGSMELELVQTDVVPFVRYFSESFHSLAETKMITLTVYSEIESLGMDIDINKLGAILSNLLSNAIKFTSDGGKIIVHLHRIKQSENHSLQIKVQDNGHGIAEKDLLHLFERFYQVTDASVGQQMGSGIGLSITKEFVELMNGEISVESSNGKGTTFLVQIPITNTAIKKEEIIDFEPSVKIAPPKYKRELSLESLVDGLPLLLIIEDNLDVTRYLETCLHEKYRTIHAPDGEIGMKIAFENMPDIIISDVMMPHKNGYEVCETLKTDERTDHIPIILLTAKVTAEDRLTGLAHGADAYLSKPFNKAELFTRLDQLISVRKKMISKLEKNGFSVFLKEKVGDSQTKFLQEVIKLVLSNLDNAKFGASLLADEMRLSESQIYRKLKSITDKSTAVFIRSVRLQKAKELLQTTNKTVSEIGYEVGFNDPSWFSRSFKEEFGFSPRDIYK